jgi:hypothetical protein
LRVDKRLERKPVTKTYEELAPDRAAFEDDIFVAVMARSKRKIKDPDGYEFWTPWHGRGASRHAGSHCLAYANEVQFSTCGAAWDGAADFERAELIGLWLWRDWFSQERAKAAGGKRETFADFVWRELPGRVDFLPSSASAALAIIRELYEVPVDAEHARAMQQITTDVIATISARVDKLLAAHMAVMVGGGELEIE